VPLPLLAILAAMGGIAGTGAAIGASRRAGKARNPLEDDPNADVIDDGQDGMFLSGLEAIGRPGKIVNNALMGNWEGAGRQLVDLGGDILDAPLPGDWIDPISRRKDKPEFSDVVGGMEPGVGKFAVDVLGGVGTDPLSLVPGAAVAKGAGAIGKGVKKGIDVVDKALPGTAGKAEKLGRDVRSVFGAQRISPEARKILDRARAGQGEAAAGMAAIKAGPLAALSDDEATIVSDIMDNLRWDAGKPVGALGPEGSSALDRVSLHQGVTPENQAKIASALQQVVDIGQNQAKRPGIFSGDDLPGEYLARSWKGQTEDQAINEALGRGPVAAGSTNAAKGRSLKTPEDIAGFMEANPGMQFERNAKTRMASRAEQQGTLAARAEIGRAILGDDFAYADDVMKKHVNDSIDEMAKADPESAKVLADAFRGMAPRGAALGALAKANRVIKPMMVYGAFIPKFGAIVRNRLSGAWQALSNPEARGQAASLANPLRAGSDLLGALDDGITQTFGFQRLTGSALTKNIDAIDQAMKASGGSLQNALAALPPDLSDAVRTGVLDGFVSSEQLVKEMGRTPFKKQFFNVMNWPGRVFKGVEDRMRLGMFLDLKKTMSAEEAARVTRDTFYDYGVSSVGNRTARDIIPFFQFPAKAIVQQGKFLAEKPVVAGALSRATEQDPDQPVYPWMEGKLNIPIGGNEDGTQDFISGLGLPFEALNMIPDASNDPGQFFRSVQRDTVGASQPLLKTALGATFGEDPYFGTQFGTYDKIPLWGEAGDLGKAYNVAAGTGLLQPVDSPLRTLGKAFDERRDLGTRALDLLTGANVVSVDPDLALRQQLQAILEANPDVRQHRSFYGDQDDAATQELLAAYKAAKGRLRAKRSAVQ
jgi:hypothetical protein